MSKKFKYKPQPKKNWVEFKPRRGRWVKAELINTDKLDRATLKLENGNLIKHTILTGFHYGIVKKKRKKVILNAKKEEVDQFSHS